MFSNYDYETQDSGLYEVDGRAFDELVVTVTVAVLLDAAVPPLKDAGSTARCSRKGGDRERWYFRWSCHVPALK